MASGVNECYILFGGGIAMRVIVNYILDGCRFTVSDVSHSEELTPDLETRHSTAKMVEMIEWMKDHGFRQGEYFTKDGFEIVRPDAYFIDNISIEALFLLKWT